MSCVRPGSIVTIRYIGTLDNGRIFDSTDEHGPLTFTVGAGEVFPALERAILGMQPGDSKNIVLSAEEAYGPRRAENILRVSRKVFPAGKKSVPGQKLSIDFADGSSRVMRVTAADEDEVTLDGNHPLAGLELTFALQVDRVE
jgi:peptidylprolyl isomerase